MDFGLIWYFLSKKKKSSADMFMANLEHMLQMHKHHLETTTALYRNEFEQAKIDLKKKYAPAYEQASKIYKEVYDNAGGTEYERDTLAVHEAGYQELEHDEQLDDEQLMYRFSAMADYFNKSSLVITYALCENQLRRYCELLKEQLGKRIKVEEIESGDYLESMFNYLDKVIEVDIKSLEPLKSKLKDLQFLRNRIMHNGGEFPIGKNDELERIINASDELLVLIDDRIPYDEYGDELQDPPKYKTLKIRKVEYLDRYISCITELFERLCWLSDEKLNFAILKDRFLYLNGFLAGDLSIGEFSVAPVSKGFQLKAEMLSAAEEEPVPNHCTITITRAAENKLAITDQFGKSGKLTRLANYLEKRPEIIINEFLQGFNLTGMNYSVSIIYY